MGAKPAAGRADASGSHAAAATQDGADVWWAHAPPADVVAAVRSHSVWLREGAAAAADAPAAVSEDGAVESDSDGSEPPADRRPPRRAHTGVHEGASSWKAPPRRAHSLQPRAVAVATATAGRAVAATAPADVWQRDEFGQTLLIASARAGQVVPLPLPSPLWLL